MIGSGRGPAPSRTDDPNKPTARSHQSISKFGPEHAEAVPFVEFNPAPGDADPDWHPLAQGLYESLKTDPARVWMGTAGWATARVMCEGLSRELSEQIVGWSTETQTEGDTESRVKTVKFDPILGKKTVTAGFLGGLLRWMAVVGINEGDRLRLTKEITFGTTVATIEESRAPDLTLIRSEALRG